MTFTESIPQDGPERLVWETIIALPIAGLLLVWWIVQRPQAHNDNTVGRRAIWRHSAVPIAHINNGV